MKTATKLRWLMMVSLVEDAELDMGGNKLIGRCDRIRTYDPFAPSEVRYQAALHTDRSWAVYVNYFCLQR